jgi:hypothetical protein
VWPLFPIGVRELLAVPGRFIVLFVPGRFIVLFVLCEGTFECCAGCDGRLGAELCAGALAWGAGALGCGAGEFLCCAAAKIGTATTNPKRTKRRTVQETTGWMLHFIADSSTRDSLENTQRELARRYPAHTNLRILFGARGEKIF